MAAEFPCSLKADRTFNALLNGLSKRLFHNEVLFTDDFIIEQIYSDSELEKGQVIAEIESFEELLLKAGENNWDENKMEKVLNRIQLSSDHTKILLTFWGNERNKVHQSLLKKCTWNHSLKQISWRVDVKAASKNISEINEPTAFFEISTSKNNSHPNSVGKTASFEMNRIQISEMVNQLDLIQKKIDDVSY